MNMAYMKIVFWNSRSIRNKIFEFNNFLTNNNIDICLLSEGRDARLATFDGASGGYFQF